MADTSTILIIGASRGLGLALAEEWLRRGWRVIATVREASLPLSALVQCFSSRLEIETLDISNSASVTALRQCLAGRTLDILFVNAGICLARDETPGTVEERDFADMMLTNALAPMRAIERFADLVPASGTIAAMSSEIGSIARNEGHWELYSASKAALNMLMKCHAARHRGDPRGYLLVAPGFIRTDMGGPHATFSVDETIPAIVDTVMRNRGRAGLRFLDRFDRTLPW